MKILRLYLILGIVVSAPAINAMVRKIRKSKKPQSGIAHLKGYEEWRKAQDEKLQAAQKHSLDAWVAAAKFNASIISLASQEEEKKQTEHPENYDAIKHMPAFEKWRAQMEKNKKDHEKRLEEIKGSKSS